MSHTNVLIYFYSCNKQMKRTKEFFLAFLHFALPIDIIETSFLI
ncbi:hypothetical protein CMALT430_110035 [Carnobacterium maltaromaticum]|nr:hypothetical protein CMALT430_110035 [Carnobacterium maltaromaticum]